MSAEYSTTLIPKLNINRHKSTVEASEKSSNQQSTNATVHGPVECNENDNSGQAPAAPTFDRARRASESGTPCGRTTPSRLSLSGTPQDKGLTTPRGTPRITPRENRSSSLRKSVSGMDGASLRSASSLSKEGSPSAINFELTRLRDDLRAKQKEADKLGDEVATLKGSLASKERALAKASSDNDALKTRVLQAEGDLANKTKDARGVEGERNKLRAAVQDLEREADKLTRKLNAAPKGTGFSEAIATLEAEVKSLKAENARLDDDNRGAYNQIRAKDKQLDTMAMEVEEARHILIQNGELENYILDLRRQLQEASEERATLMGVQRQNKADMAKLTEQMEAANAAADRTARELALSNTQLKASEENAAEMSRELELRKGELTRVTAVASRATVREASSIKDEGMVPFAMHKEEVMHLKGEIDRLKEKVRLGEKSAAATQLQMERLFRQLDAFQGKTRGDKVSPRGKSWAAALQMGLPEADANAQSNSVSA